ncbi:MAG: hypothetical protein IT257_07945 [Chitinophagaceae bacterium]|nr:hypothetical protein [Chitinophagaceae bacterium]
MKSLLLFLPVLLFQSCFSQTDQANNMLTVQNHQYRIQYPNTWRIDSSRNMGTELIFYSPLDNAGDPFSENVNLMIQNLQGMNIDLQKYKEITEQQLKELGGESKIYQSAILTKDQLSHFRMDYQMTQENRTLRFTAMCYIKDEKAYLLTFTSSVEDYEKFKNAGESILKSFALTP